MGLAVTEGNIRKRRVVLLSGGVGGARLARGLAQLPHVDLTVIVNVGDDANVYGLHISPDIDTVLYTLAEVEGPDGWGVRDDTFRVLDRLESFGMNTAFRVGDLDLAVHIWRTYQLERGVPLSLVTDQLRRSFSVKPTLLPASDDSVRTKVRTIDAGWLDFQDYFVSRGHQDFVSDVRFDGAEVASPAPGVERTIEMADIVLIAPSNPPLSIWPILAIPGIASAVDELERVVAVSPLFGGRALKGPADQVLASLGLPAGNEGVVAAYDSIVTDLVIDEGDAHDKSSLETTGLRVHIADTRIEEKEAAVRFGSTLLEIL